MPLRNLKFGNRKVTTDLQRAKLIVKLMFGVTKFLGFIFVDFIGNEFEFLFYDC
jgi:hypothetical protein